MAVHAQTKHPVGALGRMGVVVGLHAALIILVVQGSTHLQSVVPPDIIATFIDQPEQVIERIPVPQPVDLQPREIRIPVPDTPIVDTTPDPDLTIQAQPLRDDEIVIDTPPPMPDIIPVQEDARRPLTLPMYPSASIRNGEEGTAQLNIYVLPDGRVGDVKLLKSTGFDRLDRAAMEEARRRWRLVPAKQDGVAVGAWYRVPVTFRLEDAARR